METIPLLKTLSEAVGITGREEPIRQIVREAWEPLVDEVRVGGLGSLIALKRGTGAVDGPRPGLMLAAHVDEIGLVATGIEKGFVRVTRAGGSDRRALLGVEVVVHGARDLPGVIATRPPHVLPQAERSKSVPWEQLFVDVGLPADEVDALVSVGDVISFRREMVELQNRRVAGKAMDDRASVAAITLALEQLATTQHAWDVYAVATVQEEVGLKGATAAAYGVAPQVGLALDVTFGKHPGVPEVEAAPLGSGPVVMIGPNFHPRIVARLKDVAQAREIPFQVLPAPGRLGTDAWAIQVTREGIPTGLICIPLNYMHQPVEMVAAQDVERAGRLLAAFCGGLEPDFVDSVTWDDEKPNGQDEGTGE